MHEKYMNIHLGIAFFVKAEESWGRGEEGKEENLSFGRQYLQLSLF